MGRQEKILEVKVNHFLEYGDKAELDALKKREAFTVTEVWEKSVNLYPDAVAVGDGVEYTYAQADDAVAAFRGALISKGVKRGDRVGVFIPNSFDCIKAFLAIATMGGTAVMMPPSLDEKTVYGCALKFGLKALVYAAATQEKLALVKTTAVPLVPVDEKGDKAPSIIPNDSDPAAILFTGGTTGRSKGAMLSNRALLRGAINGCYGYKGIYGERYLLVLPLTHVFGLVRDMLTPFLTGSAVYICRNPKDMFKEMAKCRPTVMILVPALAEMSINLSKKLGTGIFGGALRHIICGASTVPPHLVREYGEIGVTLLPGYGLTESANLVSGNPLSSIKPTSVGLPYAGQKLKIVDGELWLKGDNIMTCYVGDEEENAAAFEDGWFKTGDLVRFDDDGYMYIVGRIKELIVLHGGEKVSPAALEDEFCAPDYVNDALVYDEGEGENQKLILEVVLRPGFDVDKETAIKELNRINATLPTYARVNKVIIRDEDFPRSAAMKKLRPRRTL